MSWRIYTRNTIIIDGWIALYKINKADGDMGEFKTDSYG